MSRASWQAPGGHGGAGASWWLLAGCWGPVAAVGLVWSAGHAASWLCGQGWVGPSFSTDFVATVIRGDVAGGWPGVPPALVWALSAAGTSLVLVGAGVLRRLVLRTAASSDAVRSLATARDVAALTPAGVASRAVVLRPSLGGTRPAKVRGPDRGVALGRLRRAHGGGPLLRASWEDVILAVMAPRAGKTTALAVPALLEAPGAVVATSNKADLWAATAAMRAASTGERVWVFDPQRVAHAPQTWWWDPLREVGTVEEAHRLAGHFIQEVRGQRARDFWTSAAHDLLTGLLLAAAVSGRTLVEVYEWLNDPVTSEPSELLRERGRTAAASSLQGRQHGAPETRDGVYETARTAAQCLRDDRILTWVTPPDVAQAGTVVDELDATAFAASRQTLYLLSRDGAGNAAPLVAALTDRIMREATLAAERRGGRLDPPMLVVLDEAANVCRISDLPDLYSHLGSRGVVPLTILQSYRQGTRVWGEMGMDALWSAATCKVIGSGLDDAKVAEDLSRLVGDHDVQVSSVSRTRGQVTNSTSVRRQRILPPDAVRALPRGSALLLATGCRAALLELTPWYAGEQAAVIAAASATAEQRMTELARGAYVPSEPHRPGRSS